MEQQQNLPIIAKRIWSIARVVYFMLKKSFSKRKPLLADLRVLLNRGKLAGKALAHLISALHHNGPHRVTDRHVAYEFSCTNSPALTFPTTTRGRLNPFARAHAPPAPDEIVAVEALRAVMEMMNGGDGGALWAVGASPAMPGFGRSPLVAARGLRVTDSPFPLAEVDEDSEVVDRAAEEFIKKFYRELKEQKSTRS